MIYNLMQIGGMYKGGEIPLAIIKAIGAGASKTVLMSTFAGALLGPVLLSGGIVLLREYIDEKLRENPQEAKKILEAEIDGVKVSEIVSEIIRQQKKESEEKERIALQQAAEDREARLVIETRAQQIERERQQEREARLASEAQIQQLQLQLQEVLENRSNNPKKFKDMNRDERLAELLKPIENLRSKERIRMNENNLTIVSSRISQARVEDLIDDVNKKELQSEGVASPTYSVTSTKSNKTIKSV